MKRILYYGDNGRQEFWETARGDEPVLFFHRNHGEGFWWINLDYCLVEDRAATIRHRKRLGAGGCVALTGKTVEEAARKLKRQNGVEVVFDGSRVWKGMVLVRAKLVTPRNA